MPIPVPLLASGLIAREPTVYLHPRGKGEAGGWRCIRSLGNPDLAFRRRGSGSRYVNPRLNGLLRRSPTQTVARIIAIRADVDDTYARCYGHFPRYFKRISIIVGRPDVDCVSRFIAVQDS